METTDHPNLYFSTCCSEPIHYKLLLIPLFCLSFVASVTLSVLVIIQWGWGMFFVVAAGAIYVVVFISLFYNYKPKTLIPTFAVFEVFKIVALAVALVIGVVHLSDKYTHDAMLLVIYGAVYIPLFVPVFVVFCRFYVYTDWDAKRESVEP